MTAIRHRSRWQVQRPRAAECERYRPALLSLLLDPSGTELVRAARDHLDRCGRCRTEVSGTALADLAVKRTFASVAASTPPDDAWPRLRRRLERRPQRFPRFGSSVAGLILAAGMATALVVPATLPSVMKGPGGFEALEPAPTAGPNGTDSDATPSGSGRVAQSPAATVASGKETRSHDQSRARVELMRYELAPEHGFRAPRVRSLSASAQ